MTLYTKRETRYITRTVPAISNVMATLSKLGFPADKEEAVAA